MSSVPYTGSSQQVQELQDLQAAVANLPNVDQINAQLAAMQILISGLTNELSTLTGNLNTVTQTLNNTTGTANTAKSTADTAKTNAQAANDGLTALQGSLNSAVSTINTALGTKAAQTDLTAVSNVASGAVAIGTAAQTKANTAELDAQSGISAATAAQLSANNALSRLAINGTFRNRILNPRFDFWQRGTSQSGNGTFTVADKWILGISGSSAACTQDPFIIGQTDVPGAPKYFMRTVVTSVVGTGNVVDIQHHIEGVGTYAGKTVTLSFWARADVPRKIGLEFYQYFGVGGSTPVAGIGAQLIQLTATWALYTATVAIPSITGKVLGTNGFDDQLDIILWLDAGSSFASRNGGLTQQSGTFDFAMVQLDEGNVATPFENRPSWMEQPMLERYFEKDFPINIAPVSGRTYDIQYFATAWQPNVLRVTVPFRIRKTAAPTIGFYYGGEGVSSLAYYDPTAAAWKGLGTPSVVRVTDMGFSVDIPSVGGAATFTSGWTYLFSMHWTANADI